MAHYFKAKDKTLRPRSKRLEANAIGYEAEAEANILASRPVCSDLYLEKIDSKSIYTVHE